MESQNDTVSLTTRFDFYLRRKYILDALVFVLMRGEVVCARCG